VQTSTSCRAVARNCSAEGRPAYDVLPQSRAAGESEQRDDGGRQLRRASPATAAPEEKDNAR